MEKHNPRSGIERRQAGELAWEMFEKTGNVSYYLLFKDLTRR